MAYTRKGHKTSNGNSRHHQEGELPAQATSSLPTGAPHRRAAAHAAEDRAKAQIAAGWGRPSPQRCESPPEKRSRPPRRAPLTSLPPCHSRCSAAGKPASASIRAFTSPTAAEGGSSKVLQPRQSWRTLTRASLRRHNRHQLRDRHATALPLRHPAGLRRAPETRSATGGRALRGGGKQPPGLSAEPLPQRRFPSLALPSRPAATHMPAAAHKGPLAAAAAAAPHTGKGWGCPRRRKGGARPEEEGGGREGVEKPP